MGHVLEAFDLSGRAAIVTGAGSGLGSGYAEALAEAGANILCVGRHEETLESETERLRAIGVRAEHFRADVTDEDDVKAMTKAAIAKFGRVDILVNNAGVAANAEPQDFPLDDWEKVIKVNLTGVFLCAREAGRAMIETGHGGSIINVASVLGAGASAPRPTVAYAASKGGVVNLTRDLAVHWACRGVRVNAIGPAYFPSGMTKQILEDEEVLKDIERRTPMGRIGRPEELKAAVLFLASTASSYVTGQTLYVDGGWTAS